jgi:hypothetical protein
MTTPHRCGHDSDADGFLLDGDYDAAIRVSIAKTTSTLKH